MLRLNLLISCFVLVICLDVSGVPISPSSGCQSDILILVDSTGSVSKIFNEEKLYVQKLLNKLDPVKNHVALIVYSSKYRHTKLLSFKSEQTRKSISNLASLIPFFNGVTHNGAALSSGIKELENRRSGIPANLVVVTDGFSFDHINEQAALLRSLSQLRTFAVSVGQFYQRAELLQIAGDEKNVFVGTNSADDLVKALGICGEDNKGQESNENEKTTPQKSTDKKTPQGPPTNKPTDNKTPQKSTDKKNPQLPPTNKPTDKKTPQGPSKPVENETPKTPTHPPSPTPPTENVPINPVENKPEPTKKPTDLKPPPLVKPDENGYDIEPVHPVKKEIPSKPVDKNVTPTPTKHEEKQVVEEKRPTCSLDVVFILDVSSSVKTAFDQQKTIAADIYEFLIKKVGIHYSIVKFSGNHRSKIVVPMSENKTAEQFRQSLELIHWNGGTTYIVNALKQVTEMLGNHSKEHKTLIIVITDGFVRDDPEKDVKDLQSKGTVFLVPSAKDFPLNKLEFKRMASQEKYAFMDRNLDNIKNGLTEVTSKC